jgi:hypothetical protein
MQETVGEPWRGLNPWIVSFRWRFLSGIYQLVLR